jgi:urease accessory protein
VLATVLLAGPLFATTRERLLAQLDAKPVVARSRLLESASALGADALVVRLAAASVEELLGALRTRLGAIPALLGDDPWARRA